MNRMPWVLPDTLTASTNNSPSWFAGARSKKDKDKKGRSGLGTDQNRDSVCSINTFGQTLDMSFLSASPSVSAPTSSEPQQSESFSSSTDAVGTSTAHQSKIARHKKIRSTFGFLQEIQRQQCGLVQPPFANPPAEPRDDMAHDKGAGVGSSSTERTKRRDEKGLAHDKATSRSPKAPQTSTSSLPLMHDPTLIESEICALRYQIRQATTVLTHVVQTMSVPSPTALINVMQDTAHQEGQTQGHQPHPNGCSCAILHARDDGKFGTGREIAFLAACYCPDPWGFQERILRQIDLMQQEIQTLRQEMLEVERRATISLRQEMIEWEKVRDKEWVELNERLQRSLVVGENDNEECMNSEEPSSDGSFERYTRTESGSPQSAYTGTQDIEVLDNGAEDHGAGMCEMKEKNTCQSGGQGADPNEELPVDDEEVVFVVPNVDTSSAL